MPAGTGFKMHHLGSTQLGFPGSLNRGRRSSGFFARVALAAIMELTRETPKLIVRRLHRGSVCGRIVGGA